MVVKLKLVRGWLGRESGKGSKSKRAAQGRSCLKGACLSLPEFPECKENPGAERMEFTLAFPNMSRIPSLLESPLWVWHYSLQAMWVCQMLLV